MRWSLLTLLAGTITLHSAPALAPAWPSRPVRVMVGFAPGGPNDIIARAYGARLADSFSQPFVVENRTGAGGNLAPEAVARAVRLPARSGLAGPRLRQPRALREASFRSGARPRHGEPRRDRQQRARR